MSKRGQIDLWYVNDLHSQRFTVIDEDSTTPDDPLDLTGRRIKWAMISVTDPETFDHTATPVLTKDSDNVGEVTIVDAANGIVDVIVVPADYSTNSIGPGNYYFQLGVFDGAGTNKVGSADGVATLIGDILDF